MVEDEERERATREALAPGDAPVGWLEGEDAAKFASDPWRLGHVIPAKDVIRAFDDDTEGYDRELDPLPQQDWILFQVGRRDPEEVAKEIAELWDSVPLPFPGGRNPRDNPSRLTKINIRRHDDPPFQTMRDGSHLQAYERRFNNIITRAPGKMAVDFGKPEWFVEIALLYPYDQYIFINPNNGIGIYMWLDE